jgi:UDP-3-O-acyl-N-acetylglucosamine deacetylase
MKKLLSILIALTLFNCDVQEEMHCGVVTGYGTYLNGNHYVTINNMDHLINSLQGINIDDDICVEY